MREDIGMAVNTERDQLAEDILYLEYLIDVEKNDIKRKLTQRVTQADSDDGRIAAICDEISSSLAQLSARVVVLEKVLASRRWPYAPNLFRKTFLASTHQHFFKDNNSCR
jgi:hypothetical protein